MKVVHRCFDWYWISNAVRRVDSLPTHPLVALPATVRSLKLARAICASRPCWITRARLFEDLPPDDPLRGCLRTPAEIVRQASTATALERTVITIPEQIVGNGPSFDVFEFAGTPTFFSMLESVLILRHAPPVFIARSRAQGHAYELTAFETSLDVRETAREIQGRLLGHLSSEAVMHWPDWRAEKCLSAKTPFGYQASKREHYRDLEAMLRLLVLYGERDRFAEPLSRLRRFLDQSDSLSLSKAPRES